MEKISIIDSSLWGLVSEFDVLSKIASTISTLTFVACTKSQLMLEVVRIIGYQFGNVEGSNVR